MLKSGLKAGGHHDFVSVLEVKRSKIFQNWNKGIVFVHFLGFIFYAFSHAKTDLYIKCFNLVYFSFLNEQDHLLNLTIWGVYMKRRSKCASI